MDGMEVEAGEIAGSLPDQDAGRLHFTSFHHQQGNFVKAVAQV